MVQKIISHKIIPMGKKGSVSDTSNSRPVGSSKTRAPTIAGVLFLVCVVTGLSSFILLNAVVYSGLPISVYQYASGGLPLNWPIPGNSGSLISRFLSLGLFHLSISVLIGCGVISLTLGKKDIMKTGFLVGLVLSVLTAMTTLDAICGILTQLHNPSSFIREYYSDYWRLFVGDCLVCLIVPIIVIPLMKSQEVRTRRTLRVVLIVAMVIAVLGVSPIYGLMTDIHEAGAILSSLFFGKIGSILLFAALLILTSSVTKPVVDVADLQRGDVLDADGILYSISEGPTVRYAFLGFLIPIIGFILFLVWREQTPHRAKLTGICAVIGTIVYASLAIIGAIITSQG